MNIKNWSSAPSGGAITVTGADDADGRVVKLRGVKRIESGRVPGLMGFGTRLVVQAVMPDGVRHTLV